MVGFSSICSREKTLFVPCWLASRSLFLPGDGELFEGQDVRLDGDVLDGVGADVGADSFQGGRAITLDGGREGVRAARREERKE